MNARRRQARYRTALPALICALALNVLPGTIATAQETSNEFGRLFFTPEQRQVLDRQRRLHTPDNADTAENASLTINGVVIRSSGKRTVWVNGISRNENDPPEDLCVTPLRKAPGNVIVKANDSPLARAKVGDTIDRNSGESDDLLSGGVVIVKRKP